MVRAGGYSRRVTLARRSYFDDLLAAGVKVYQYGPRLLHTKALLVDDEFALIGSANFDNRSFRLNFELSMLFHDGTIAAELAALRSEEHTSELQSLMRISYAVFCLKKKTNIHIRCN